LETSDEIISIRPEGRKEARRIGERLAGRWWSGDQLDATGIEVSLVQQLLAVHSKLCRVPQKSSSPLPIKKGSEKVVKIQRISIYPNNISARLKGACREARGKGRLTSMRYFFFSLDA